MGQVCGVDAAIDHCSLGFRSATLGAIRVA
jgi:hypothetical protein